MQVFKNVLPPRNREKSTEPPVFLLTLNTKFKSSTPMTQPASPGIGFEDVLGDPFSKEEADRLLQTEAGRVYLSVVSQVEQMPS